MRHGKNLQFGWRAWSLFIVGIAVIICGSRAVSPPIYDGMCVAGSYQKLGEGNVASVSKDVDIQNGATPTVEIATSESPPQAQLLAETGAFLVPAGVTTVHLSITAVAATASPPSGMAFAGNVYRFSSSAPNGTAIAISTDHPMTVVLRSPSSEPNVKLAQLSNSHWQVLTTFPVGCANIFQANTAQLGDFVLLQNAIPQAKSGGSKSSTFPEQGAIIVGIALGLLLITIALRRLGGSSPR